MAITGPSGCGKTTLLSMAAGLLKVDSGQITLFGQSLDELGEAEVASLRSQVGLVFQNYHLDDTRSTEENILLAGFFSEKPWSELRQRAESLAASLDLTDCLPKKVSVLSGGQKQRVAIARALVNSPALLLADEPTGALDRRNAQAVLDLFEAERSERKMSILAVTHDEAVQVRASQVLRIANGSLSSEKEIQDDEN